MDSSLHSVTLRMTVFYGIYKRGLEGLVGASPQPTPPIPIFLKALVILSVAKYLVIFTGQYC